MPVVNNLNMDTLGEVFLLLSGISSAHESLANLRKAAQVCKAWRETLLHSGIPWARSMDFVELKSGLWADEVIRRTKNSKVWIGAYLPTDFFLTFAENNWDRIEHLEVSLPTNHWIHQFHFAEERILKLISRPAPSMKIFNFKMYPIHENEVGVETAGLSMLGNDAPFLQAYDSRNCPIPLSCTSFKRLHSLTLDWPTPVDELLIAFRDMNMLQSFKDLSNGMGSPRSQGALPYIDMPSLQELVLASLRNSPEHVSFILHVSPADSCVLKFHTLLAIDEDTQLTQALAEKVARYAGGILSSRTSQVVLRMTLGFFYLVISDQEEETMDVQLTVNCASRNMHFYVEFFHCLAEISWARAVKLQLNVDVKVEQKPVEKLLLDLVSIKSLSLHGECFLTYLSGMTDEVAAEIFPSVQNLELWPHNSDVLKRIFSPRLGKEGLTCSLPAGPGQSGIRQARELHTLHGLTIILNSRTGLELSYVCKTNKFYKNVPYAEFI